MANELTAANEGSTYIVNVSFYNEDSEAMVPTTMEWSLRANYQQIINSHVNESITPATTVTIVLTADDLLYEENSSTMRVITMVGTYNSSYGTGLDIAEEFTFNINPLVGIPDG